METAFGSGQTKVVLCEREKETNQKDCESTRVTLRRSLTYVLMMVPPCWRE